MFFSNFRGFSLEPSPLLSNSFPSFSQQSNSDSAYPPNFASLDNAVAEISNAVKNGCGRFPTGADGSLNTNNNFEYRKKAAQQRSPSPDLAQNNSLSSSVQLLQSQHVAQLPHPRPKHNLLTQLPQHNNFYNLFRTTSPNFPQPTSNSVAMRISALEKVQPPSLTSTQSHSALLQQPLHLNMPVYGNGSISGGGSPATPAPMSPRSTVFRTKPILHMELMNEMEEEEEKEKKKQQQQQKLHSLFNGSPAFKYKVRRLPRDSSLD